MLASGCEPAPTPDVRSIAGSWAFHPGDDPQWASPAFDDTSWARLQVPGSWGRQGYDAVHGIAWYRLRVSPPWPPDQPLGITIGKVNAAYELYVDGVKIGGVGQLPPNPVLEYDRHATFALPLSAPRPSLTIALRVWRPDRRDPGDAGPTGGPFEIGPLPTLLERAKLLEVDRLALFLVFVVVGIYMTGLWLLRPAAREYGLFALVAICSGGYSFFLTQWKYTFGADFLFLKKSEHLLLYVTPILIFEFLWVFVGRPRPRWLRAAQVTFGIGGLAVVLTPGMDYALWQLPWLEVFAFAVAVAALGHLAWWSWHGDRNARTVAIGTLAMTIAMTHDAFVDRGLIVGRRFAAYGFAVLLIELAIALALRFHHAVDGLAELSRDLEARVNARTRELADAYRRMEDLALRDPLTTLLNRRAIEERASAGLAQARRRRAPYGVALIDVDHFKAINDTHGHASGDRVLVAIARALSASVRVSDDVSRWGGEEFLVLLPESGRAAALQAAERIRAAVEATFVVRDEHDAPIRFTVSIGVAAVESAGDDPDLFERLTREADRALYEAKEGGRNRVRVAARG